MKLKNGLPIVLCWAALITIGCKKRYDPPRSVYDTDYLVVEGIINSGKGPTNIRLSRTSRPDSNIAKYEEHALVKVQDEHNNSYTLTETGKGLYSIDQLNLNDNEKYRLYIKTNNSKEYVSTFSQVLRTPPIDTVTWERQNGVQFFVSTHDLQNKAVNYRWAYEETWEFHSLYTSSLEFDYSPLTGKIIGLKPRSPQSAEAIYRCWSSQVSTDILQGTSEKLSRDTFHLPFNHVPKASWKISVLYSINIKQYAISSDEYEFWRRLKKNTEQIGTIFDEQPSQLNSNIHCTNDPKEVVIGYIGVADEQQKRVFIRNSEVPWWEFYYNCEKPVFADLALATLNAYKNEIPLYYDYDRMGNIAGVFIGYRECADCTLKGTNVKPTFWP